MTDMDPISPEDALSAMRDLEGNDDYECAHDLADVLLCRVLIGLGYRDLVDAFDRVGKWYA